MWGELTKCAMYLSRRTLQIIVLQQRFTKSHLSLPTVGYRPQVRLNLKMQQCNDLALFSYCSMQTARLLDFITGLE